MNNLATKINTHSPVLEQGKVTNTSMDTFEVKTALGIIETKKAVSCLVEPQLDDMVLISLVEQQGHILAVLERPSENAITLAHDGDITLRSQNGNVSISTDKELTVSTTTMNMAAQKVQGAFGSVSLLGKTLESQFETVRSMAVTIDTACKEMTRRVGNYFRFTSEHEDKQSRTSRQLVEETMTVQSKNTVMTAEEDVKVDGRLVHLG